jgi:hypothetical protein
MSATTTSAKMVTLHCQAGNHTWERPSQRGKRPFNCPEHAGQASESPAPRTSERRLPEELQPYLGREPKNYTERKLVYIAAQVASGKREQSEVTDLLYTARLVLRSMKLS